jgi:hypothetical protein
MAAKKLEAKRRVQEELDRQKKELDEWLELCDETETTGLVLLALFFIPVPDSKLTRKCALLRLFHMSTWACRHGHATWACRFVLFHQS